MGEFIAYTLEPQRQLLLRDGIKLQITRSKQEDLFRQFSDKTSEVYKFTYSIASDPLLRCLFFFKSKFILSVGYDYFVSLAVPLLLDYDLDLLGFLKREDIDQYNKTIKDRYERLCEELKEFGRSMTYRYYRTIFSDRRLITAFKSGSMELVQKSLKRLYESKKKEIHEILGDIYRIYPIISELRQLEQIVKFTTLAGDAQLNSKSLKLLLDIKNRNDYQIFHDALKRLASQISLEVESFCLHCTYRERDMNPYHCIVQNPKELKLDINCPKCHGAGLIHLLRINMPFRLGKFVYPDPTGVMDFSWLNEFIIGFKLSELDFVDSVMIHKKIHRVEERVLKGVEIDIALVTRDKHLIIVEVTRQHSIDNILDEITKKKNILDNAKIPYDLIFYVTAHTYDYPIPLEKGKVLVLGIKHIHELDKIIKHHKKDF